MSTDPPHSGKRTKFSENRNRGLPSVHEARAERRRTQWLPPRVWLWALVFIAAGIIFWWKLEQGEVHAMRADLLSRQRTVVAELGPRWFPLRDKLEKWTEICGAEAFIPKTPDPAMASWDFRRMPGIYLRLAQGATKSVEGVRDAASKSLRDGFTSCLLTVPNPSPLEGPTCLTTQECERGRICNEFSHCVEPSQPFNLRTAYKTLQVMDDEWVANIQEVSNKLTMRGAVATFEAVNQFDLPIAADLLQRSKYFLVVVDEPVPEGTEDDLPVLEAEAGHDDRSIPTAPHAARVCLWRLEDDKPMVAVRLDANGELRGPTTANPGTRVAQQRQANSCSLALSLREALGVQAGAVVAPAPPPVEDTKGEGGAAPAPSASAGAASSAAPAPSAANSGG